MSNNFDPKKMATEREMKEELAEIAPEVFYPQKQNSIEDVRKAMEEAFGMKFTATKNPFTEEEKEKILNQILDHKQ